MRGTKNLWISLVAVLLASMATLSIPPGACAPATILSVDPPTVKDEGLIPGSTFTIDIYIADVQNMWGYLLFVSYDPNVLTATGNRSNPIWGLPEPSEINDEEGYITIAYHMPFGAPAGFTGSIWIAEIDFMVDAVGWSWLDLHDTVLGDPFGKAIAHEEVDGLFANIPQQHAADLVRRSAWPQYHHWVESKHPEQTLWGKVRSLGNVPTTAYVNFTVKDGDGLWEEVFLTDAMAIDPTVIVNLYITITSADLIGPGKYYVKARCWYDDGTGTFVPSAKIKSFAFALV